MKAGELGRPCEAGDWGDVLVIGGRWRGHIGVYDDDETARTGIVIFGFLGDPTSYCVRIARRLLRRVALDDRDGAALKTLIATTQCPTCKALAWRLRLEYEGIREVALGQRQPPPN